MAKPPHDHHNERSARFTAFVAVTCKEAHARMWEYLDGELDTGMKSSIRAHLSRCDACRARHDADLAHITRVLHACQSDRASEALRERVDALLRERGLLS